MNHSTPSPICERESDLVSFLYDEASETEARDFELHLQQCHHCQTELASFGLIRESIGAWKDEALTGFVPQPAVSRVKEKSASAALRQFFDLSPLWMKGAVGFATVLLCLMTILVLGRFGTNQVTPIAPVSVSGYSDDQVKEKIANARTQWMAELEQTREQQGPVKAKQITNSQRVVQRTGPGPTAKRRPLSKSERAELAADLRLLSAPEEGLNLLSDRINQ